MTEAAFITVRRAAWSALNVRLADLETELRAWRAWDTGLDEGVTRKLDLRAATRNETWRAALSAPPSLACLLGVLLDAGGEILTHELIFERMRASQPIIRTVEWPRGLVTVQACKLRKVLREAGLGEPIETIRGVGYRLAADEAARLATWLEVDQRNQSKRPNA
jgi:DNA-binding response OmpR family regulator